MGKIRQYIYESTLGGDGKPSSKKQSAFLFCALVATIVLTLLLIGWLSTVRQVELKANTLDLLKFIGGTVLVSLLMAVGALFGVQGWQQVSSLKIMNPAPPDKKVTITQEGENPEINVENAEIKDK